MLQADLKVLGGKFQGKLIPMTTRRFLVGREQDCHLRPNSESVSRHHCAFILDDFTIRLRDLGSTNGTRVNDELIRSEVVLKDGDQIHIGKLQLELSIRKVEVAEAPAAPPVVLSSEPENESTIRRAGAETMIELPTMPELPVTGSNPASDTAILGGANTPAYGIPQYAPPAYPQMPQMPGMPQPTEGYALPPGYPAYPPGYPPGYPQPYPQGYPAMPPGYPGGYPAAMPGYQPVAYAAVAAPPPPAVEAPSSAESAAAAMPMRLPPPESTGVKAPAPAPAATPPKPGEAAPKAEEKPSQSAADIIKQYMQRRTR